MIHYFDNCATTRVDDDVLRILNDYAVEKYYNPSARSTFSMHVANDLAVARENIADKLGVSAGEIYFTSGGTESDNIAVLGALRSKRGNIVVSAIEHSAVYNAVKELGSKGYEIRIANTLTDGHIDVEDFLSKVDEYTVLACFMHVSNETGAVNDVKSINASVKSKNNKTVTFSDGVQAVGKIPVNIRYLGVDLYSFASHKIHGSKGVGCLFVKNGVKISSLVFGGGQEKGLRSGTEYVGGIIGLAKAVELAQKRLEVNTADFVNYKKVLRDCLAGIDGWRGNCKNDVSPAIMSLSFQNVKGEVLLHMLENYDIIVGTGSACSSKNKQSRLVKAIGLESEFSEGVIRISFSKYNTLDEVKLLGDKLVYCVNDLRKTMLGQKI